MFITPPLSLTDRFLMALEGVYAATAARFRSVGWSVAMVWAVCSRIRRAERRVMRLLALFQAGALPAEAVRPARRACTRERPTSVSEGARLPRRFGWLLPMVPCAAANFASQLRLVLDEPEMRELLAASAAARRALGPVCRMLAVEMPVVAAGVQVPVVEAEAAGDEFGVDSEYFGSVATMVGFRGEAHPPGGVPRGRGPPGL